MSNNSQRLNIQGYLSSGEVKLLQRSANYYYKNLKNQTLHIWYYDDKIKHLNLVFKDSNFLHLAGADTRNFRLQKRDVLKTLVADFETNEKNNWKGDFINSIPRPFLTYSYHYDGLSEDYFMEKNYSTKQLFSNLKAYQNISYSNCDDYDFVLENVQVQPNNKKIQRKCLCIKYNKDKDYYFTRSIYGKSIDDLTPRICLGNKNKILMIAKEDRSNNHWEIIDIKDNIELDEAKELVEYFDKTTGLPTLSNNLKLQIQAIGQNNYNRQIKKTREKNVVEYIRKLRNRGEYEKAAEFNSLWLDSKKTDSLKQLKAHYHEKQTKKIRNTKLDNKDSINEISDDVLNNAFKGQYSNYDGIGVYGFNENKKIYQDIIDYSMKCYGRENLVVSFFNEGNKICGLIFKGSSLVDKIEKPNISTISAEKSVVRGLDVRQEAKDVARGSNSKRDGRVLPAEAR